MVEDTNETPQNETETGVTLRDLQANELEAIQMRYLGKASHEIAKVTGYEKSYVRRLFMRGGRLEKPYESYALEQREETRTINNAVLERAKVEARDAFERIIQLSKSPNMTSCFNANKYLLSLVGLSQDNSLRAMMQGMSFDDARKLIDKAFQDIFQMSLDAKMKSVVFIRPAYHCDHCGKDSKESEMGPEEWKAARDQRRQKAKEEASSS